jgi:hypothetical protein
MKNVRVVTFVTSQSLQTGAIIVARLAALKADTDITPAAQDYFTAFPFKQPEDSEEKYYQYQSRLFWIPSWL